MKMRHGYSVEYSDDDNEVCIVPSPSISTEDFLALTQSYSEREFKYWLPADSRCGYLYCKDADLYYQKNPHLVGINPKDYRITVNAGYDQNI